MPLGNPARLCQAARASGHEGEAANGEEKEGPEGSGHFWAKAVGFWAMELLEANVTPRGNHTDSDFERNRYIPLQRGLARLYVMWL